MINRETERLVELRKEAAVRTKRPFHERDHGFEERARLYEIAFFAAIIGVYLSFFSFGDSAEAKWSTRWLLIDPPEG